MGQQQASGFCEYCHRDVLVARDDANHTLHLILTLFLCGLWLVPWLVCAIFPGSWRCQTCGSIVRSVKGSPTPWMVAILAGFLLVAVFCVSVLAWVLHDPLRRPDSRSDPRPAAGARPPQTSAAEPTDELARYKANIGRTAFNKSNGQEQGRIEGVAYKDLEGEGLVACYSVRYRGELRDSPVDNVTVRAVASTVAEK